MSTFVKPASELPRDKWSRPLITPPDGGKTEPYTRVTTFAGALEDTYNIEQWKLRMAVLGMSKRRDLQLSASAITDPKNDSQKRTLNSIAKAAMEAAGSGERAAIGTALHSWTEVADANAPLDGLPEEFAADIAAYSRIIAPFGIVDVEGFCINDELKVGGTYDRILRLPEEGLITPDGDHLYGCVIGDLKTGDSVELGQGKIAQQLGIYANSVSYDHRDGSRSALPGDDDPDYEGWHNVSRKWGIVIHLPAGSGKASLLWVDLEAGWEAAQTLSAQVRKYRSRRDLMTTFSVVSVEPEAPMTLTEQIQTATSEASLIDLWRRTGNTWTPGQVEAASRRKAELLA